MTIKVTELPIKAEPEKPVAADPLDTLYLVVTIKIDNFTTTHRLRKLHPYVCQKCGWDLIGVLGTKGVFKDPSRLTEKEQEQLTAVMETHDKTGHDGFVERNFRSVIKKARDLPVSWVVPERDNQGDNLFNLHENDLKYSGW